MAAVAELWSLGRLSVSEYMDHDFMMRGYLLPEGCKDLIDVFKFKPGHEREASVTTASQARATKRVA
jgi:hypothetical protein